MYPRTRWRGRAAWDAHLSPDFQERYIFSAAQQIRLSLAAAVLLILELRALELEGSGERVRAGWAISAVGDGFLAVRLSLVY